MSYPPNREPQDPESQEALINGNGNGEGNGTDTPVKVEDEDEEAIEEVRWVRNCSVVGFAKLRRRYEDFSTVGELFFGIPITTLSPDWIQDALHERKAAADKRPPNPNSINAKLSSLDGVVGRAWRLLAYVFEEGQTWVVITLVGMSPPRSL